MKKTLIAVALVLLVLAAMPYAVGWVASMQYRQMVQRIDAQNASLKLEVTSYQRGFFSSSARLRATFTDPRLQIFAGSAGLSYDVEQTISHGPLVPTEHGLGIAVAGIRSVWHSTGAGPDANFDALLDTGTNMSGRFAVADYDQISNQATIQLHGLKLDFSVNRDVTHFDLVGGVDSAAYTSNMGDGAALKSLAVTMTAERGANHPWVGPFKVTAAELEVHAAQLGSVRVENPQFNADSQVDANNNLQAHSDARFETIHIFGEPYGPLQWQLNVTNLDAQAILDLSRELQHSSGAQANAQTVAFMKYLPALLRNKPVIELKDFSLQTPTGRLITQFRADVDQATSAQLASPFTLLQTAHAELHARIEAGLMHSLAAYYAKQQGGGDPDALLKQLLGRNLVQQDAAGFRVDVIFAQGQVRLNGKPLQIPL